MLLSNAAQAAALQVLKAFGTNEPARTSLWLQRGRPRVANRRSPPPKTPGEKALVEKAVRGICIGKRSLRFRIAWVGSACCGRSAKSHRLKRDGNHSLQVLPLRGSGSNLFRFACFSSPAFCSGRQYISSFLEPSPLLLFVSCLRVFPLRRRESTKVPVEGSVLLLPSSPSRAASQCQL